MFLEQAREPKNKNWRYLVGFILIVLVGTMGGAVHDLAIIADSIYNTKPLPTSGNESIGYFSANTTLLILCVYYAVFLIGIYFTVKYLHRRNMRSVATGRAKLDWNRIFFAFGISALYWTVVNLFLWWFEPGQYDLIFRPGPFALYFCILLTVSLLSSFQEQFFFRGYFLQGLASVSGNRWLPLLIVSLLFSRMYALHPEMLEMGFAPMFVRYFSYALFLGILTLMDDGVELAIGFDAANRLVEQSFYTAPDAFFKPDSIFTVNETAGDTVDNVFVIGQTLLGIVLFLWVCSKKYKWSGWREKLTGKLHRP
jgi:membrane protease YdiL (CAAX protease family)